jgi:hypothetical protein
MSAPGGEHRPLHAAASIRALHVVARYPTIDRPHRQVFVKNQIDSLIAAGTDCEVLTLQGRGLRKYFTGWWQALLRRPA